MQEDNPKHWLDQLEVTDSIKGIMDFVDELSRNYDRRLAALHVDYQNDVEEILACYKHEKQEFTTQLEEQKQTIDALQVDLSTLQKNYNTLNIEHKLALDSLETARQELSELAKVIKQEDELVAMAKERIRTVNEQLRQELELRGVEPAEPAQEQIVLEAPTKRKTRFKKTTEFLQQVIADRLSRRIILRPKKQEPIIMPDDEVKDTDEYSF